MSDLLVISTPSAGHEDEGRTDESCGREGLPGGEEQILGPDGDAGRRRGWQVVPREMVAGAVVV